MSPAARSSTGSSPPSEPQGTAGAPTDPAALRFRIEGRSVPHPDEEEPISTSGIVWMGEATGVNSQDLLAVQNDEDERPVREEAAARLAGLLGVEPVASKTVKVGHLRDDGALFNDGQSITTTRQAPRR